MPRIKYKQKGLNQSEIIRESPKKLKYLDFDMIPKKKALRVAAPMNDNRSNSLGRPSQMQSQFQ